MKTLRTIGLSLISVTCLAFFDQQGNIDREKLLKIFNIYETSIQAYVDEIVSKEYPGSNNQELIRSRKQVLLINVKLIEKSVLDVFEKNKENKKEIYLKLIDGEYRNYYPGLSPAFFKDIHKKVNSSIEE